MQWMEPAKLTMRFGRIRDLAYIDNWVVGVGAFVLYFVAEVFPTPTKIL